MSREHQVTDNEVKEPTLNPISEGIALASLSPLDTICVQTRNSCYRIFLLDPQIGRALVEGGSYFTEPVEAFVDGSVKGSLFRDGWIATGMRVQFWTNGRVTSTSPVQSFHIETHTPPKFATSH